MFTRQAYLDSARDNGESFRRYYGEIIAETGFRYSGDIARVRAALAQGDMHLNTIPLGHWDCMAAGPIAARVAAAFKARGDYATLAGMVCLLKEAARLQAEKA